MFRKGALIGGSFVALAAASLAVAPAFGASEVERQMPKRFVGGRSVSGFTPAAADPRLAAAFARSGLGSSDFRFTPSEARGGNRPVTVAVRARSNRVDDSNRVAAVAAPTVGLVPVAYNLGVSVGWKRFAVTGDVAKVDLAGAPGSREIADVGVSYSLPRFTGRVKAAADRALPGAPKLVEDAPTYSLDVGGSYSLTRNIDLTAGVRYKSERERLARFADDRRDSQAVYVGTAFRF
ncbi:porin [Sphingomonas sp. TZW2008]|uniref:porin n=1 Tax=Sphingomonas sp. TZW2008 TaxID=1917973 RepID=UPI000A267BB5|nr:porin [Sphingomonas sp. TZW2008]